MRFALLTSESPDPAVGSGTAVAIAALRAALRLRDVEVPVFRPTEQSVSQTLARWRFNRELRGRRLHGYDAVLGVNGDGFSAARTLTSPYMVLVKALYSGAKLHERGLPRVMLAAHAHWEGLGARRAALVVTPSRFAARAVVNDYGVAADRVRVITEPFDAAAWRRALPSRMRAGNRVLCVAHLYPRKRVIDLLRAWPRVLASRPDARLDVVGAGPELDRLAHQAQGLHSCYLHGHVGRPDIVEFYARADCFCLPSAQETFGYSAVEAMASGLPLVIAAAGALPETCQSAVASEVKVGDTQALADAIISSLDASTRRHAEELNPRVAERFEPANVADQLIAAIREARAPDQRRVAGSAARRAGSRT